MVLSVRYDDTRPGGGYAVLGGEGLDGVTAISVESSYSGQYLGANGTWGKVRALLPVAAVPGQPGTLSLGPQIVDAIATDTLLVLRGADNAEIGRVFWTDIIPTRGGLALGQAPVVAPAAGPTPLPSAALEPEPKTVAELETPAPQAFSSPPTQEERPSPTQEERQPPTQEERPPPTQGESPPPSQKEGAPQSQEEDTPPIQQEQPAPVRPRRAAALISRLRSTSWLTRLMVVGLIVVLASIQARRPKTATQSSVPSRSDDVLGIVPRDGQQPSFKCQDDMSEPIAKLICADADLAEADGDLDRTYRHWLAKAGPSGKRVLRALEKNWMASRNERCGIPSFGSEDLRDLAPHKACLLEMIQQRNEELQR